MVDNYTTRLTVRTTVDLKGAYLGLCRARGVVASDEIRAFMVRELAEAVQDKQSKKAIQNAARKEAEGHKQEKTKKCADTADMFHK